MDPTVLAVLVIALLVAIAAQPLGVKVTLPEGQQRSGKQGGVVWSHNRGGPYIRARSIPTNPNTDRQVATRNAMRNLAIAWQVDLSQAERDAWDVYAANVPVLNPLGQSIYLTGLNHFIRSNTLLVRSGIARVDAAPVIFDLGDAEAALSGSGSEATQQITCAYDDTAAWCSEDGAYQFFFMGLPQNSSIKFFKTPYRMLGIVAGSSGSPPTSPYAASAPFPFAQNQRIWVRTRIARADARLSEFAQDNFLAGA